MVVFDPNVSVSGAGPQGVPGDSAFVYIRYAADNIGTGIASTPDASRPYIAVLTTDTEIVAPVAADFTGLWFLYKGSTGAAGTNGANGTDPLWLIRASDPTVNDDSAHGYSAGSGAINTATHKVFACESAGVGAANWHQVWPPLSSSLSGLLSDTQFPSVYLGGWISVSETWIYASADAPSYSFTVSTDLTAKYYPGMKIKLTDSTVKYFIITKVSYGAPDTTITVYGGTDYSLSGGAISNPFYSVARSPAGFPMSPVKWTVTVTESNNYNQTPPTQNVWYNLNAALNISIPIGLWDIEYTALVYGTRATIGQNHIQTTLSTANNSQSDADFHSEVFSGSQVNAVTSEAGGMVRRHKHLVLTTKTTYYFNIGSNNASMSLVMIVGGNLTTSIKAICAYL